MSKMMIFDDEARRKLLAGVEKTAAAVRVTMGPKGRNVVLEKAYGSPTIINDGVSIAREIDLEDPYENLGAQLIKEVANKTNESAGDGTTTATVLAHEIYKEGLKTINAGVSPIAIKRGIEKAVRAVVAELGRMKKDVANKDEIAQVATISANNDEEIGLMIADAMEKVGKDGVVTIEESKTAETKVETTDGMQFDQGYISPYLATNASTMEAVYDDVGILVSEDRMDNAKDFIEVLYASKELSKPILVIADDFSNEVLTLLVVNKLQGGVKVVAVKIPGFGDRKKEMVEDIAVLTGAKKISTTTGKAISGMKSAAIGEMLGYARRVIVDRSDTTIVDGGGNKEELNKRVGYLKSMKDNTDSEYDKTKLQERISKLTGGVAVLSVGASTQTEMTEKKLRVEDALNATRAAIAEGIVAGGGVALVRARKAIDMEGLSTEERLGAQIVYNAVISPLAQIAKNAGINGEVAVNKIEEYNGTDPMNFGLNASTGQYVDMFKAGIIDPTKVTRTALENAASVAGMMLTTECVVVRKREDKKAEVPQQDF
jgi:chaperonin GroEL